MNDNTEQPPIDDVKNRHAILNKYLEKSGQYVAPTVMRFLNEAMDEYGEYCRNHWSEDGHERKCNCTSGEECTGECVPQLLNDIKYGPRVHKTEQLYRWVKASDRLPTENRKYTFRDKNGFCFQQEQTDKVKIPVSDERHEWLEPVIYFQGSLYSTDTHTIVNDPDSFLHSFINTEPVPAPEPVKSAEEIAKEYIPCTCGEIYLSRKMKAPDCPLHSFDIETAMEAYGNQFQK